MADLNYLRFAEILVDYSLNIKPAEKVVVAAPAVAAPLVEKVYEVLLNRGAYPVIRLGLDTDAEIFYRHAQSRHLDHLSDLSLYQARHTDAIINIMASSNTKSMSTVDPAKQARVMKTSKPVREIIMKKDRWVLTLFPTAAYAQDAEMSLDEFREFVGRSLYLDRRDPIAEWQRVRKHQEKIVRILNRARTVRIADTDTDLTLSVKGRTFINSSGLRNMPCGEVFTGPVETSAEGHIAYSFPACYSGREVEKVHLEFSRGRVVKAAAAKNEKFLLSMLDLDAGARYLGEFAIGLNYGIRQFIKNILFDEKIGGTVHLALGNSYPETGGRNKSALHWDMIKDLRTTGELYVDGELFMSKGKLRL